MSICYDVAKDFAAPAATLFAALALVSVTWHFNRIQKEIASSQRDIAFDKLKLDTFEKRYEIYSAAKSLIECALATHDYDRIDHMKIIKLYAKLDESRFYFSKYIREFIDNIHELSETYIENLGQRTNPEIDRTRWSVEAEKIASDKKQLREMYSQLPRTFEPALAFTQLTAG
jgi:hypothetical protein